MHTLVVWAAQYLLFVMAAVVFVVWLLREDRPGKVMFALQAVVGVIAMVALLYVAKTVHHDPRPFVENPHIKPLFGHSRDDGFPSDHSLAAGLMATLVLLRRHWLAGGALAVAAVLIAWARVAAHVHHLQDVVAGLLLGAIAAVVAFAVVALVARWKGSHDLTRRSSRV